MLLTDINPHLKLEPLGSPIEQIREAMTKAGIHSPEIIIDGNIHRFSTTDKKDKKSGWYIFFDSIVPCGAFGDFRTGQEFNFVGLVGHELSVEEIHEQKAQIEEAKKKREEEKKALNKSSAERARNIYESALDATREHPYLIKKKVDSHGLKIGNDNRIIIPVYDPSGEISSLQFIDNSGGKKFLYGGAVQGCFFPFGSIGSRIYICEGYATGATIFEATGCGTICTFSASNLEPVAVYFRSHNKTAEIIIVGDHDESGTGQRAAEKAAETIGGSFIIPPDAGQDINDFMLSGGNVSELLTPKKQEWLISADDFCLKPEPIKWLVKGWLPERSLAMVHGPSGCKKTFFVLDLALSISSGMPEFCGNKVQNKTVVYLAGEGHHGLKSRIAGWKQEKAPGRSLDLFVSRSGACLDEALDLNIAINNIRALPRKPALIIVDTLHRFMTGDENKAQDAGKMIKACAVLQDTFECSVLIVHHTGVSEEAQARARGSSAWRGALDIEISVKANKAGDLLTIEQLKNKDAEPAKELYISANQVELAGWVDDDGEPVTTVILTQTEEPKEKTYSTEYNIDRVLESSFTGEKSYSGNFVVNDDTIRSSLKLYKIKMKKADFILSAIAAKKLRRNIGGGGTYDIICPVISMKIKQGYELESKTE